MNAKRSPSVIKRMIIQISACLLLIFVLVFLSETILTGIGERLVLDEPPIDADAVVVLYTGVDYYPCLIEAARIYNQGLVKTVVINGNRKTDVLRSIEKMGFAPNCDWSEDYARILELHGVSRADIIAISAEDVFDSISEADAVGSALLARGILSIILTTSKFHTRRARHIWQAAFKGKMAVTAVAAKSDPYTPSGWWKEGLQIRWVMAEYGAWGYYWWHALIGNR
jgi:uncharacterized SAM-binding protein YcdF (DUF218 family)